MLLRRKTKPAPFKGYTDAEGFKTPDAPRGWPFGKRRPIVSKAKPKNPVRK